MSGSLPPGMPDSWYAEVVAMLAPYGCKVAVDTSDRPLAALVDGFDRAAPDLIKPNAEELAGVIGYSPQALEAAVAQGDPEPVRVGGAASWSTAASAQCSPRSAPRARCWSPTPAAGWPRRRRSSPRSTVGAGDSSLAGYLRADVGGAEPPQRLQMAVAYGSAAAALPGSALPTPGRNRPRCRSRCTPISPYPRPHQLASS